MSDKYKFNIYSDRIDMDQKLEDVKCTPDHLRMVFSSLTGLVPQDYRYDIEYKQWLENKLCNVMNMIGEE